MITHLRVGFALRCFQRLSFPDIATQRCPWQDSWQTSGQFTPVLSSRNPQFLGAQTIPSPVRSIPAREVAYYLYRPSLSLERFAAVQVRVSFNSSRYGVKPNAV